jgi:hypothetical protein
VSACQSAQQAELSREQWQASHVTQAVQNLGASDAATRLAALSELRAVLPDERGVASMPAARAVQMHLTRSCGDLHAGTPGVHAWGVRTAHSVSTADGSDPSWRITDASRESAATCAESGVPEDSEDLSWPAPPGAG